MKSPKLDLRRTGLVGAVLLSTAALTACSAGHVSQTANQVAAVNGTSADTTDGTIALRDVTVIVDQEDNGAALKFTAINQDPQRKAHSLTGVKVAGQAVTISELPTLEARCLLVADSAAGLAAIPKADDSHCITYATTSLINKDFAPSGQLDVEFSFDNGTITVPATIAAPGLKSGTLHRDEAPAKAH
ncbi:hypothetical protein [Corynebacterium caspium]|uniref:hypothetical protein n=1 Tax=Corynebacterium caspium TaxID=234828 RepID=UPI00036A6095|nr:hypothetical protein [Corynebacterium caspium]WKD58710.1 hypothetical protein CCASP_01420 [Corynebacterium caspium DSM 44850]